MSRFETKILAHGPDGNIFAILGNACRLMRRLGVPAEDITALRARVIGSGSYDEACAAIQEWFNIDRGD